MAKLTRRGYYAKSRKHISQTQIKTFIKSPRLYWAKYGKNPTVAQTVTSPMKVGKFYDALLSEPKEAAKYYVKSRGDKDAYALTQAEFDEAHLRAEETQRHPFWRVTSATQFQVLLEAALLEDGTLVKVEDVGEREHVLICGLLDRVDFTSELIVITDFKASNARAAKTSKSWFYAAIDAGYHYQFSMYTKLLQLHYPDRGIACVHVVSYIDGIPYTKLYQLPPETMEVVWPDMVRAAWNIKNEWMPNDELNWSNTVLCAV